MEWNGKSNQSRIIMKSFKEFIDNFYQQVDLQRLKDIVELLSIENININMTPVFSNKLKEEFAKALTIMYDGKDFIFEFYELKDNAGFLSFLRDEMIFKASIDQTSRDNIFLTLFEPRIYSGISCIELVSPKEIDLHNISMTQVETIKMNISIK